MIPAHVIRCLVLAAGLVGWLLLVAAVMWACGCRSQVDDLAMAKAGAIAYQAEANPAVRATIADGVMGHLLAGLDQYPLLPKPSSTPSEIRADPAAYAAAGEKAQADPQPYAPEHHEQPKPKPPGILDRMRAWAATFLDTGLMIGGVCAILVAVFWMADWLKWAPTGFIGIAWRFASAIFPPLARIGALWGGFSAALGAALTWLADWWWAVLLVAVVCGGLVAWAHWRDIRRWLAKRRAAL
jgi:hypothetical protein